MYAGPLPAPLQRVDPDGLVHWIAREQDMARGNRGFPSRLSAHVRDFGNPFLADSSFTEERWREFRELLDEAHAHRVRTLVFVTPVHPELMSRLPRGYRAWHASWAERVKDICAAHGAEFRDFTDPASFGGSPKDFYDGVHYDDTNAALLVRALIGQTDHAVQ
jgi:lysophospholipase L1-like esterase